MNQIEESTNYQDVANCFSMANEINLELADGEYSGKVVEWSLGKALVFKFNNIDQNLVSIPRGYDSAIFRVSTPEHDVKNFRAKILQKKMPRILFSFPIEEDFISERESKRYHTHLDTPLAIKKRQNSPLPKNDMGLGTIVDISKHGVGIISSMEIKKEDRLNYFIELHNRGEKELLSLTGLVKQKRGLGDGTAHLGLQHHGLDERTFKELNIYLARREAKALPRL